ncbi:MAG: LuxR family transcriptional regulator, partial [Acidimicrobiales bacterium]
MGPDLLEEIRSALARHDWQGAFDAARVVAVDDPALAAERDDLLAEAAWWLGRLDDCIEAREAAYRGFDELGDSRRAGQCAVWLYEHHLFRARPAIAGGWLQRARRSLEGDTECEAHGALQLREAEAAHGRAAFDVALDLARPALAVGRALRSANLEAEALQTIGRVLIDQGHVVEGMAHLDEAMLFAVEGRLGPYSTGKVYCSLISVCEDLGDLDRAAEWTEATMTWAHQHPFAIFPGICRVHRAVVLKRRGSLAEAEVEAARAAEELLGSHLGNTAAAYAEVGDICRRLGQLERAEAAFAQAEELRGQPCGAVALLRVAQGRTDAALAIVTGCLQSSATPLGRATLLPIVVQVAIAAGELDLARSARVELDEVATALGTPLLLATALAARGRVELATGDAAAARTTFEEVAEQGARGGH